MVKEAAVRKIMSHLTSYNDNIRYGYGDGKLRSPSGMASFSDVLTFAVPAYDIFLTFSMSSDDRALAAVFVMTEAKCKEHHVINDLRTLSFSKVIY